MISTCSIPAIRVLIEPRAARSIPDGTLPHARFIRVHRHGERTLTEPLRFLRVLSGQRETTMTDPRPNSKSVENENLRPDQDGEPPRPATEPKGSEGSSNSGETETDPATGEQN
jgi:hypothetical protein